MQLNIYNSVTGFMRLIPGRFTPRPPRCAASATGWRAHRTPPTRRGRVPLAAGGAPLIAALLLAACGGGGQGPTTSSTRPTAGTEGRPLSGQRSDAGADAIAAATRFARGYLAFQAGRLSAGDVPAATRELHAGLKRLRVPPASRARRTRIVAARLERIDASSARVTVQVRNVDEQLTYPLPIDLVRRGGRWAALSAGDDA
jgi:hypothetical protein